MFRKRAKINWPRLRDSNNAYFHASLKGKMKQTHMSTMYRDYGTMLTKHEEIEEEILRFYGPLVGFVANILKGIDIKDMRQGN